MKVKEIERTVNTSWSPVDHYPILLAAGTAAQQLDASFNTSASLEVYGLNLTEPSLDLELKTSIASPHRFHKVSWGGVGAGTIVGGCDNGVIQMYDVAKLLAKEDSLVANTERHTGPVKALDFNPTQKNLLATGATNSEIFLWDVNNTGTPMTPGTKSQPHEDVAWLAWNRQVQHILASTFPTRSVIWDLRKNEPIIKLTDTTTRVRWKVVAWHPEVATQLCLASEEDTSPLIQLWDLRFATAPVKTFHGHSRGVLSLAWCSQDPDLLISSGKDNKIFCWDPNTTNDGEIVCEIPNSQQWIFDVSWCPRNPSLIVSSSCDGHTSIYSLLGGTSQMQMSNNKIAESFPGMGDYTEPQIHAQQPAVNLKKAPKWLRKQCGARFGFGGKLVTYGSAGVTLNQVHEDDSFLERARQLEQNISQGRYDEICRGKQDPIWRFLEASFSHNPRTAIADLLGYNRAAVLKLLGASKTVKNDIDHLSGQLSNLGQDGLENTRISDQINSENREHLNGGDIFENLSAQQTPEKKPFKIITDSNDVESRVCKALLVGGVEEAIEICLNENKMADALVLAMAAGPQVLAKTQIQYFKKREGYLTNIISALVSEDWSSVVQNCELKSWKEALTAILTYADEQNMHELIRILGSRLEQAGGEFSMCADICYIASGNVGPLIQKRTSEVTLTALNMQELVELVLVSKAAMSSHGHQFPIAGDVATLIVNYSETVASLGDLETAMKYLNDSQDERIIELRTRLGCALGHNVQPAQNVRKGSMPYQQNVNNSYGKLSGQNAPNYGNSTPMNYASPANYASSPSYAAKPVQPPPPAAQLSRNSPSPQIQSGNMKKYVVDPSVAGGGYNRGYSQQNAPQVPMFGSTQVPNQPSNFQSYNQPFSPPPAQTSNFQSFSQFKPTPAPPESLYNPPQSNYQGIPTQEMASAQYGPASGWNDPPVLTPRSTQPKQEFQPLNPITHPLLGSAPPAVPEMPQYQQINQNIPSMPPPQVSQIKPQGGYGDPPPLSRPPSVSSQPKPQMPQQYVYIQNTFEDLRNKCVSRATPLQKRKLEDVARKLETLYDLLREGRLSPNTLGGLEQLVQCIQNLDYVTGLAIITQMVSGSDFSQIATFMTGLKILFQTAQQLNVN